ncbi:MAG: glycosyltransferase [Lachnospiraceae bacterium]|nr:glycosyltransferase [Lachnospiraceae bacterium]
MISVIVPIYNTSEYLEQCVGSILNQTYSDLEIILVDDGSSYLCGKACDEYALRDSRIKVIHKENGGSTSARKAGLKIANGDFVSYVDGDDWIEPDYYERMVATQKETGVDIVSSGHFHDIGTDSRQVKDNFPIGIYTREQLLPALLYSGRFFEYGIQPHMVTKLFKKDIVEKAQMCVDNCIVIGEDAAVVYQSVLEAEKICVTDICGYHYVQNEESMTKREQSDEVKQYRLLFEYLECSFKRKGVWDIMAPQLEQYKKYLIFMRDMSEFDRKVLWPYGGISKTSKVAIYGAGVLGQKIYKYLSEFDDMSIILWVDRNYKAYLEKGMNVRNPADILEIENYDYVLIANTVQQTADAIKCDLVDMGIEDKKILWFSEEFMRQNG